MFSALVENVTGLIFVSIGLVTKWQGSRLPDPTPVGAKGPSQREMSTLLKEQKKGGSLPFEGSGPWAPSGPTRGRTNSSIEDASSRMWPSKGIMKRFVRGGHVARCLWSSGYDGSGISCTENVFETQFFTTNLFQRLVAQNDAEISQFS